MKLISIITALLFVFTSFQEKHTVEVFNLEKESSIEVHARNNNPFPVTIELEIDLTNLNSSKRLPLIQAIPPESEVKLTELSVQKRAERWGFNTSYRYYMGSIFADHNDNFVYRLPYRLGTDYKIAQGYNGDFSHSGQLAYSIDFDLPEGTPIYSARSGVVVELQEDYTEGGSDKFYEDKANYITIVHNDGTFAEYSHLRHNGVSVNVGQRVRTGQLIGYSGATGYATGPHLHFHVKKAVKGGDFITIPTKFSTQNGTIQLREGESYKAL
ncbi:MAG: M23 family metallopeptidase [Balneolaceae bacterium]|nr:M23 family metallopeptidase [Balneolaceae bacterium]MBO6547327.1 M23 family metallopeptidase [Balneolaceae bacterium]MBO6647726.1 M23 family metallopeptidase [Balneolaceae bacterium]